MPDDDKEPVGKIIRKVESIIIDSIRFSQALIYTFLSSVFKPTVLIQALLSDTSEKPYVLPYSYLTIGALLGSVVLPSGSLESLFFRSSSLLKSLKETFTVSSPEDALVRAFPILFFTILTISLLRKLLERDRISIFHSMIAKVLAVAASTQLIIALLRAVLMTMYSWIKKVQYFDSQESIPFGKWEEAIVMVLFYLTSAFITLSVFPLIYHCLARRNPSKKGLWITSVRFVAAVGIAIVLYWSVNIGARTPHFFSLLTMIDNTQLGNYPGYEINSGIVQGKVDSDSGTISVLVLIKNDEDNDVTFYPNQISVEKVKVGTFSSDSFVVLAKTLRPRSMSWQGGDKIATIKSKSTFWIEFETIPDSDFARIIRTVAGSDISGEPQLHTLSVRYVLESLLSPQIPGMGQLTVVRSRKQSEQLCIQ
jgi:hypothetical protein